jgi:hypothetical protein
MQEEKWYSTALKEEVDKLEAEKQERLEAYQTLEQVSILSLIKNLLTNLVQFHGDYDMTALCLVRNQLPHYKMLGTSCYHLVTTLINPMQQQIRNKLFQQV